MPRAAASGFAPPIAWLSQKILAIAVGVRGPDDIGGDRISLCVEDTPSTVVSARGVVSPSVSCRRVVVRGVFGRHCQIPFLAP